MFVFLELIQKEREAKCGAVASGRDKRKLQPDDTIRKETLQSCLFTSGM